MFFSKPWELVKVCEQRNNSMLLYIKVIDVAGGRGVWSLF